MFGVIGQEGGEGINRCGHVRKVGFDGFKHGFKIGSLKHVQYLVENGRTICIVNSQHIKVLFRIWKPDSKLALQQVVNKVVH